MATTNSQILPAEPAVMARAPESLLWSTLMRFRRDQVAVSALLVLGVLSLLALGASFLGDTVLHQKPNDLDLAKRFLEPSAEHWIGTDDLGRDVLTRLLYGARISLGIGIVAGIVAVLVGGVAGAVSGYFGGVVDDVINALINTLLSVPTIFLLILLAAFVRPSPLMIAVIIGLVSWIGVARLVRGGFLAVKARDYTLAARVVGATDLRIIMQHIMPNVSSTLIVVTYIDIANAILAESSLSFLGLGVQPPDPSWGNMLQNSLRYLFREPYLILPPGLLIFLTVLCLYLLGDGLRDALDPRLKE